MTALAFTLSRSLGPSYFSAPVFIGEALSQTGQLSFFSASSALATTFQSGNATAAVTYTLPTAGPSTNSDVLSCTIAGAMSWVSAGTFGGDVTINGAGNGVIVTTPDGLHTFRIAVDNFGGITTEQLT